MLSDFAKLALGEKKTKKTKKSKSCKKCTSDSEKSCEITTVGTYCDANEFVLSNSNLPYEKCQNFPKIIKNFIKCVGLCNLIRIAETVPNGTSGGRAAAINEQYSIIQNFTYKGFVYAIRFTLTKTDGTVIYDSEAGTTDATASSLPLHTTRMEIQRATEREWGAMKRSSSTTGETYVYTSIWIPNILLLNEITDLTLNTEVLNFRFAYQVDETGRPLPSS